MLEDDRELDTWWERFVQERSRALAKSMGGKAHGGAMGQQAASSIPEYRP